MKYVNDKVTTSRNEAIRIAEKSNKDMQDDVSTDGEIINEVPNVTGEAVAPLNGWMR